MSISIGSTDITDIKVGSTNINKVYVGSTLVWERTPPPVDNPFYVTSDENFNIRLTQLGTVNAVPQLSTDGESWLTIVPGSDYPFQANQIVYIRNVASNDWSLNDYNYLSFLFIEGEGSTFKTVGGNAKSLINNSETLSDYCFIRLFENIITLQNASELILPWMTLAERCYQSMFVYCISLTQLPSLPATTLAESCYGGMFNRCSSLTQLPALPATTLAESCYGFMFGDCSNIKLSETQTGEYVNAYRIPTSGTGEVGELSLQGMFELTGGTFTGTPNINTTYYTSNTIVQ